MHITDYEKVNTLTETDLFLLDGSRGTKTIFARDLGRELLNQTTSSEVMSKLDFGEVPEAEYLGAGDIIPMIRNNTLMRTSVNFGRTIGSSSYNTLSNYKHLGTSMSSDQLDALYHGRWEEVPIGSFWTTPGHDDNQWLIIGHNYMTHRNTNHLAIMRRQAWTDIVFHSDVNDFKNVGYKNCDFRKGTNGNTAMEQIKNEVYKVFDEQDIIQYGSNMVSGMSPNGDGSMTVITEWTTDCKIELPTCGMATGGYQPWSCVNQRSSNAFYSMMMYSPSLLNIWPDLFWTTCLQDPFDLIRLSYKANGTSAITVSDKGWVLPVFFVQGRPKN